MKILAIHDGHNSSVCLVENGKIKFAVQEERFTYIKNQGGIPRNAINYVKDNFGITSDDTVAVVGNHMPLHDWKRETILNLYKNSDTFTNQYRHRLKNIPFIYNIYSNYTTKFRKKDLSEIFPEHELLYLDHHFSHAATTYYGSGFYDQKVLILTADGDGDGKCAAAYIGNGGNIDELDYLETKHSLGQLYSYITFLYNMVPFEHEYKIMGLAPYVKDRDRINKCKTEFYKVINFENPDSIFWNYIGKYPTIQSAGKEIKKIFLAYRFDIIAAALQEFTEEIITTFIKRAVTKYRIRNVVLSGGIFMNVKANMLIAKLECVDSVYVYPSCGDETNPIGIANYLWFKKTGQTPEKLEEFYFGDDFIVNESELLKLDKSKFEIQKFDNIEKEIASIIAAGEIVGRVKGRMEFGARALGNRSIIANPSVPDVLRIINDMIKNRDFWMPFAPSVLEEDFEKYFIKDSAAANYEYMIFTAESKHEVREYAKNALHPYDYTGRPQVVKNSHNPDYHSLIRYYKELTGEGLVLNTSYNLHGFPIVRTQEQALHVFLDSGLNILALDNYLIKKRTS